MIMKNKNLLKLLEKNEKARNWDSWELEIEYLLEYVCENAVEKHFIKTILSRPRPSWATLKRVRADIQNTQNLFEPDFEIKEVRNAQEVKVREEYSPINRVLEWFARWFK